MAARSPKSGGQRYTGRTNESIFEMDDSKTQIRNPKYQIGPGNGSTLPWFRVHQVS